MISTAVDSTVVGSPTRDFLLRLSAAVAIGVVLRFAVGLHPLWWLAWLAPAPLLVLAFKSSASETRWFTALAALIALSANFHYYQLVMPIPIAALVLSAQALLWVFVVSATRRLVLRYRNGWTVFVYPVLWVAVDSLMAALLPDGNWASLAYSQSEVLPVVQLTSLFGVSGLLFLLALVPSTLAFGIVFGKDLRQSVWAYVPTALLLVAAIAYGQWRLQQPTPGKETSFGLAAIDDAIGINATAAYSAAILQQYDRHIAALAAQGATVIVLPEKIAVLSPASAAHWQQHFAALSAQHGVWLEVGIARDDGKSIVNLAWLFDPQGALAANYQKQYMAPPERGYSPGDQYQVRSIDGSRYGLAICKDMHFAKLGRAYGLRDAAVMLVPAWDFNFDAWMGARMTVVRGVENGYSVVRSSRDGLLTVSDAYGRILAERQSDGLPGASLQVKARVATPVRTLYTQIGNLLGWLCVAGAALLLMIGRRKSGQAPV